MENATKALLIAAAILIAIVLISLGVYVLSIGQNAMSGADMTEQEIATFNAKFTSYEGNNVMGSKVNALLQAVATNNVTEGTDGKQIEVKAGNGYAGETGKFTSVTKKANTGQAYTVKATTNATGLITEITITSREK